MVNIRDKVEKLPREYDRKKIIGRIQYHNMGATTSAELDNNNMEPSTTPSILPPTISNKCQHCPHCK